MAQQFYYDSGTEKIGPIKGVDLVQLANEGQITADTWVRRAESSTWRRFADIDLTKEKEIEQKRSVWRALWQQLTPAHLVGIVCLLLFIGGALTLGAIALKVLWPILLVLLVFWWLSRVLK
ncbi:MAG: GYF domain-containing protein [Akkermansia sp.]